MRHQTRGFTLIEFMIVVVIIGILAAIAVPNFILMQNRAREGSTKASMETIQMAVEDYAVKHDFAYPSSIGQIVPLLPGSRMEKNAFTKLATEPSNGMSPGSISYTYFDPPKVVVRAQGDTLIIKYEISAMGWKEPLHLVLTSGE